MSKTVIVTGAEGQDGSLMVDFLLKHTDYEVFGGVRSCNRRSLFYLEDALLLRPRFQILPFDITKESHVAGMIDYVKPDFYLNFAAQTSVSVSKEKPEETLAANYFGVRHALHALAKLKKPVRFFNAGSSEEFSPAVYSPQDEKHPRNFNNPYGISKVLAHHVVEDYRELGMFAIQPYLYNHISERANSNFLPKKVVSYVEHTRRRDGNSYATLKLGNLDAARDWTSAREVVEAIWLALNADNPKDYVIASGKVTTIRELINIAFRDELERSKQWIDGPSGWNGNTFYLGNIPMVRTVPEFYRTEEEIQLVGDKSLIYKDLGWKPSLGVESIVQQMLEKEIDTLAKIR